MDSLMSLQRYLVRNVSRKGPTGVWPVIRGSVAKLYVHVTNLAHCAVKAWSSRVLTLESWHRWARRRARQRTCAATCRWCSSPRGVSLAPRAARSCCTPWRACSPPACAPSILWVRARPPAAGVGRRQQHLCCLPTCLCVLCSVPASAAFLGVCLPLFFIR